MNKIKILIVDDHSIIRMSLARILSLNSNFSVIGSVNNGKKAVDFCEKIDVDIVLMDITMPEMNGIKATKKICDGNSKIKVIGLSMHSEEQYINNLINAGAKKYLSKNCSPEELSETISNIMST